MIFLDVIYNLLILHFYNNENCTSILSDSPGNQTGYVMNECHHLDQKIFSGNCEIAQYCGHYLKRVNGVLVEGYWSDKDGKCIVPGTVLTKSDSIRPDI